VRSPRAIAVGGDDRQLHGFGDAACQVLQRLSGQAQGDRSEPCAPNRSHPGTDTEAGLDSAGVPEAPEVWHHWELWGPYSAKYVVLSDWGSTAPLTMAVEASAKVTSFVLIDGVAAAAPAGNAAHPTSSTITARPRPFTISAHKVGPATASAAASYGSTPSLARVTHTAVRPPSAAIVAPVM
jgi:hypothetical protein